MRIFTLFFLTLCIIGFHFLSFSTSSVFARDIYRVGVDDLINITVLDHPELNSMVTVVADGSITFPHIGTVLVEGLTLPLIEAEVTRRLSEGYVKYPVVTVSLTKSMSRNTYSYGPFFKRGEIAYQEDMTLEKAISIAGGVAADGLFGKLIVRRLQKDKKKYVDIIETKLKNGAIYDRKAGEELIQPDDLIILRQNDSYAVEGEVLKRGRFTLETDLVLVMALSLAGSVTSDGMYGTIKIRRKQNDEKGRYTDVAESKLDEGRIENEEVASMLLKHDDIIVVEKSKTFLMYGLLVKTGRFVLEKNMTVLRALLVSGGVTRDAVYGSLKIRRKQEGGSGDYEDIAESRISEGSIVQKKVENILLQPDDIIVVEQNDSYFIYGEAKKTGEFVLKSNMTVFQAITIAGGLTKWGSEDKVKILRISEDGKGYKSIKVNIKKVINGDASSDLTLQGGDIIVASSGIL